MAHQILSALQECHKNGITHCDVKVGNILYMQTEDGKIQLYLSDFGCSHVKLSKEKVESRHNVRLKAFSFAYAGPEVICSLASG